MSRPGKGWVNCPRCGRRVVRPGEFGIVGTVLRRVEPTELAPGARAAYPGSRDLDERGVYLCPRGHWLHLTGQMRHPAAPGDRPAPPS